jgi:hypothetical protein
LQTHVAVPLESSHIAFASHVSVAVAHVVIAVHVMPLPVNPMLQVHTADPDESSHVAFVSHIADAHGEPLLTVVQPAAKSSAPQSNVVLMAVHANRFSRLTFTLSQVAFR